MPGQVGPNVVQPAGQSILFSLFGPDYNPNGFQNQDLIANIFGQGGQMGGMSTVMGGGRQGAFIAPKDQYAQGALSGFYGNDQNSAVARYAQGPDRFSQWFYQGAGGLPSAQEGAGRRASADFNADSGNPQNYGPLNEFRMNQGRLNADPYLTTPLAGPYEQRNAFNSFNDTYGAQGGIPNAQNYQDVAGQAFTDANNPARFGQRGVDQITRRGNQYEGQLLSDIDRQSQLDLGKQLPEVQAQMQGLGLAESGAATRRGGDVMAAIMEQANRDKMQTMAGFREGQLGREGSAINQAAQIGATGGMQARDIRSRAGQQGLADLFAMNQAQRGAEQQGIMQGVQNYGQNQIGMQDQYLRALLGSDQAQLARQVGQANVQSQGLGDYSNIFNQSNQYHQQTLQEMLGLSDLMRTQDQERLNQQLQFGMLPWQSLMTLATGVSGGGNQVAGGRTQPFWQNLLGSAAGGYAGGLGQQLAAPTVDYAQHASSNW